MLAISFLLKTSKYLRKTSFDKKMYYLVIYREGGRERERDRLTDRQTDRDRHGQKERVRDIREKIYMYIYIHI